MTNSSPGRCATCGGPCDARAATCRACWQTARDRLTVKTCTGCLSELPVDAYAWRPDGRGGRKRRSRCKACEAAYAREHRATPEGAAAHAAAKRSWNERNPEKLRLAKLRTMARRYGVDPDDFVRHMKDHDGRCEACGSVARLDVDHDHSTGRFRGLLCGTCNRTAGHAGDSPERLRQLATYLETARGL